MYHSVQQWARVMGRDTEEREIESERVYGHGQT